MFKASQPTLLSFVRCKSFVSVRNIHTPPRSFKIPYKELLSKFSSLPLYSKYFLMSTRRYKLVNPNLRSKRLRSKIKFYRYSINLFHLNLRSTFRFLFVRFLKLKQPPKPSKLVLPRRDEAFLKKKKTKAIFSLEFFCSRQVFSFTGGVDLVSSPNDLLFSSLKSYSSWYDLSCAVTALPKESTLSKWKYSFERVLTFNRYYYWQPHLTYFDSHNLIPEDRLLVLNFRDFRFFPSIQTLGRYLYTTVSLGMFSKYLNKGKSFIKNKMVYLIIASFFRKLLIYSDLRRLKLLVKRTPLYFKDMLSIINNPVITRYKHPFTGINVDEKKLNVQFFFSMFIFINSKSYSFLKTRKRGRIKRKITKRLVKINSIID